MYLYTYLLPILLLLLESTAQQRRRFFLFRSVREKKNIRDSDVTKKSAL